MSKINQQYDLLGLKITEGENVSEYKKPEISEEYIINVESDRKKKVSITIDSDLYEKISDKAKKEKRSFSSLLTYCASLGLKSLNETRIF